MSGPAPLEVAQVALHLAHLVRGRVEQLVERVLAGTGRAQQLTKLASVPRQARYSWSRVPVGAARPP